MAKFDTVVNEALDATRSQAVIKNIDAADMSIREALHEWRYRDDNASSDPRFVDLMDILPQLEKVKQGIR